jgi:hypothetical protein
MKNPQVTGFAKDEKPAAGLVGNHSGRLRKQVSSGE